MRTGLLYQVCVHPHPEHPSIQLLSYLVRLSTRRMTYSLCTLLIWYLSAAVFNILNGTLMGTWLGGRTSHLTATSGAVPEAAMGTSLFWVGVTLWALGFAGNLISDEILYNLRKPGKDGQAKPRYSIPQGFLYSHPIGGISFPAYFCEWIEWLGFALAACSYSPAPALPSLSSIDPEEIILEAARKLASATANTPQIASVLGRVGTYATPPFLFFLAEIASKQLAAIDRSIRVI